VGKFFGTYNRTLDEKKRLQIPTKLVKEMPQRLYVLRGFDGCLAIYEEDDFEQQLARLESLSYLEPATRDYIRLATASAAELDVDSHGRITISADLIANYHIGNDVVILGVLDHCELWDKAAYEAYLAEKASSYEDFASRSLAK
jgi:MraZ protein